MSSRLTDGSDRSSTTTPLKASTEVVTAVITPSTIVRTIISSGNPSDRSLTTSFSPTPNCLGPDNQWELLSTSVVAASYSYTYKNFILGPPAYSNTFCYPPDFRPGQNSAYSPGICPSSYTAASRIIMVNPLNSITETMDVCCPG